MANLSDSYFTSAKRWTRPQAMIWSTASEGILNGYPQIPTNADYIVISDHNRSDISLAPTRVENRQRMINAHMRSYHVADKITLNTSWDMLPSRASGLNGEEFTADGGAGGAAMYEWYKANPGSFYVFLAYDNFDDNSNYSPGQTKLSRYTEVKEFYFASFDYNIVKRGESLHDLWNISISLEEV